MNDKVRDLCVEIGFMNKYRLLLRIKTIIWKNDKVKICVLHNTNNSRIFAEFLANYSTIIREYSRIFSRILNEYDSRIFFAHGNWKPHIKQSVLNLIFIFYKIFQILFPNTL